MCEVALMSRMNDIVFEFFFNFCVRSQHSLNMYKIMSIH